MSVLLNHLLVALLRDTFLHNQIYQVSFMSSKESLATLLILLFGVLLGIHFVNQVVAGMNAYVGR
jgi:hypothetical protein